MGYSFSLLLLAVAISLDSFSTGLAYGLRKMHIPAKSIIIIALCTALSLSIAMFAGKMLVNIMPPSMANRIGGIILFLLGSWVVYQFFRSDKEQSLVQEKLVLNWEIQSLGIVIHILKKPTRADFDCSGSITGLEALLLGAALSLDAFGAGIGAAMLGFSPAVLATSAAFMSCIFLVAGLQTGRVFSHSNWIQKFAFMPGILLMLVGLLKM